MLDLQMIAPGIERDPRGLWTARGKQEVSYPEGGSALCYSVEDGSFWFRHRNAMICEAVKRFPPGGPVFDIGGGNGFVARGLEKAGFETVLVEPSAVGAANAVARGLQHVICATIEEAGFRPGSLSAVGLFDVIEHIEQDVEFLGRTRSLLQPEGRVYVTVPAYRWLWSSEDDHAGHFRRYTVSSLRKALEAADLTVDYCSYFFWFLPLPIFLLRTIPSLLRLRGKPTAKSAERDHTGGGQDGMVDRALSIELGRLRSGRGMIVGGSCLAVAHYGCTTSQKTKSQNLAMEG